MLFQKTRERESGKMAYLASCIIHKNVQSDYYRQ